MVDELQDLRKINLPFDVGDVDPQCHTCLRDQLKKYDKFIDENGKPTSGRFLVPCSGISKDPVDPSIKNTVDEETWETMLAAMDIVKWADKYLRLPNGESWKARWYQAAVLRCTSRRKVLRIARRCGKTDAVCVEICYYLFTEPNQKILLAAPQKSQTEEVVNRVRSFIRSNPDLAKMVVRDVSAPYYEIKLSNGSRLRGFAAGTKGKGDGVGIRGQDADKIYLEEMDFIDENAINSAIIPILQTSPNTALIGFSTPSGFDTPYRKFCESNPYYKEYHYNYRVLPHYKNIEMERPLFTQEHWDHEFEALFGQSEKGVYKPTYIEKALRAYKYEDMSRGPGWKYCIGTDWNEKYGTEIVILGYNMATSRFQIVEAIHIPRSEFTQLMGVQALLESNKKWKPSFIYIDAGNGSSNYELLRKTSYDQRKPDGDRDTAKLLDILKKYDSGSSLLIKDPITKQEKKTPAKPFMVDASLRMFEQYRIIISSADKKLQDQLKNYIIDRYTPTKTPVYGMEDEKIGDHRLDALNLAIVAFQLEFADLYTTQISVSFGPAFNQSTIPSSRSVQIEEIKHEPNERAIDRGNTLDERIHSIMPGRIDNMGSAIKTSRKGWDTDTEEQEMINFMRRKRSRGRIDASRSQRTNI